LTSYLLVGRVPTEEYMSKLPGDTKSKILDIGEMLLLKKGFNGFSYADIAASMGIKTSSIHYHFPSKCDLGLGIIQRVRQRFKKWGDSRQIEMMNDWEKLDSFFHIYRYYLTTKESVCLSGALETDFATLPPAMKEEAKGLVSDLLTWVDHCLAEGRKKGTFSFPGTSMDQAIVILAIMRGGLQMTRVIDRSVFDSAVNQIRRLLEPLKRKTVITE
jgi:TetR/AcrR family transcriptional regulator, transcriptional repressor for nem operon